MPECKLAAPAMEAGLKVEFVQRCALGDVPWGDYVNGTQVLEVGFE